MRSDAKLELWMFRAHTFQHARKPARQCAGDDTECNPAFQTLLIAKRRYFRLDIEHLLDQGHELIGAGIQ